MTIKKTNVQLTQVCHYHIRGMPKVIEGKVKYDLIFKKKTQNKCLTITEDTVVPSKTGTFTQLDFNGLEQN